MTPAQLVAAGTPLAMIHPVGGRQLLITINPQALGQALTALHEHRALAYLRDAEVGIDLVRVLDRVITVEYNRGLREKKVIKDPCRCTTGGRIPAGASRAHILVWKTARLAGTLTP
jgi:hypothetical protein